MRGATSKRVTRAPNALKMEASWQPVAAAPTITSDSGSWRSVQTSLWVSARSAPGKGSRRACPPAHTINFSAVQCLPIFQRKAVIVAESGLAGLVKNRDPGYAQVVEQLLLLMHLVNNLLGTRHQARKIQGGRGGI